MAAIATKFYYEQAHPRTVYTLVIASFSSKWSMIIYRPRSNTEWVRRIYEGLGQLRFSITRRHIDVLLIE